MKKVVVEDERVVLSKRHIQSDGYQLLIFYLLIALVVQKFFFNAPFSQIAVEFFGVLGAGLYVVIRNIAYGNSLYPATKAGKKALFLNSLLSGFLCSVGLFILAGMTDLMTLSIIFVVSTGCFFGLSYSLYTLNKHKQDAIDATLDDEEDNDD